MLDASDINATTHDDADAGAEPAIEQWSRAIEIVTRSLNARLGAAVDPALIRAEVQAEFASYSQAPVRDFIPLLVEKRVRARLRVRLRLSESAEAR